jgi:hypothetical protein
MTFLLLGLGLILAAAIVWKTDLKKSDIGLSFKNIRRSLFFHIIATIVICLLLIGAKSIAIASGSTLFPKDQPFFDFGFSLGMKLYPISVLLQEFLSQCVIHESLIRILKGKHSAVYAILLSAVLFCTLHIHRGFGYMIGSFALICFISAIYRRHRSVWGLCITHYAVSMMAFFLHWL